MKNRLSDNKAINLHLIKYIKRGKSPSKKQEISYGHFKFNL